MSPRTVGANSVRLFSFLAIAALLLPSCNVGQGVKTLGKSLVGNNGTTNTDADAFAVTLAFRDSTNDPTTPTRLVAVQGLRNNSAASLVTECGATGTTCACDFFRNNTDSSPASTGSAGISAQNNSINCVIPPAITDTQIRANPTGMLVKLRRTDDTTKNTGLVTITTQLTIEDVLGPGLSKNNVRGIFRYSCHRTFFEGEGVTTGTIACVAGQHLGVISADYHFYIFRSQVDSNLPGGDSAFQQDVCKRNTFLRIQCSGNTPDLRYGLFKDNVTPFTQGVQLTSAPEGTGTQVNYGFAALPDSSSNCPTGLVKIRLFVATPASIVQNTIAPGFNNPPSSFINTNNSLKDPILEVATPAPSNFLVNRQANASPCDGTGDCSAAAFGGIEAVQNVAYVPLTPVLCAIPKELLSGLF